MVIQVYRCKYIYTQTHTYSHTYTHTHTCTHTHTHTLLYEKECVMQELISVRKPGIRGPVIANDQVNQVDSVL